MSRQDKSTDRRTHPHLAEVVDPVRRIGLVRRAAIRWRYRHLTDRKRWDLLVDFDSIVEANAWDLASNVDELNERYQH